MPHEGNPQDPPEDPKGYHLDLIAEEPPELTASPDVLARTFGLEVKLAEDRIADLIQQEIADAEANRELRGRVAKWAFAFSVFLSLCVFGLIAMHGAGINGFALPDMVLTTLAGGTFVSAVGLFGFVVKGLFPAGREPRRGIAKRRPKKTRKRKKIT